MLCLARIREDFIRDALLYVVGFAGENQERFILRLPAKACNGSIVAATVLAAANTETLLRIVIRILVGKDGGIRDRFNEARSKGGCRDSENDVVRRELRTEIRLRDRTSIRVRTARDHKQVVHSTVG